MASQTPSQPRIKPGCKPGCKPEGFYIAVVGPSDTGKTTFCKSFIKNLAPEFSGSTMGAEVHTIDLKGQVVYLIDTAGQNKFRGLVEGYLLLADIFLLFRDPTKTLKNVDEYREICEILAKFPDRKVFKVTSKSDLLKKHKKEDDVFYVSSFTKEGIPELVDAIMKEIG